MSPENVLLESRARNRHTKRFAWICLPRLANISILKSFFFRIRSPLYTLRGPIKDYACPKVNRKFQLENNRSRTFSFHFDCSHRTAYSQLGFHVFLLHCPLFVGSTNSPTQWMEKNACRPEYSLSINWWMCFLINELGKVMTHCVRTFMWESHRIHKVEAIEQSTQM